MYWKVDTRKRSRLVFLKTYFDLNIPEDLIAIMAKKQISLLGQFDSLLRYALNMEIFVQFEFRHIASFRLVKLMQYSTKVKLRRKSTVNLILKKGTKWKSISLAVRKIIRLGLSPFLYLKTRKQLVTCKPACLAVSSTPSRNFEAAALSWFIPSLLLEPMEPEVSRHRTVSRGIFFNFVLRKVYCDR